MRRDKAPIALLAIGLVVLLAALKVMPIAGLALIGVAVVVAFGCIDMDEINHIQSLFFCNALSPMKIVTQFEQRTLDGDACIEIFNRLRLNQMS